MTKRILAGLLLFLMASLVGCAKPPQPIQAEAKITGTVTEVYEHSFLLYCEDVEGYPNQHDFQISLNAENPDSYANPAVGDLVSVYFDGLIAEIYPLAIDHVYTIALVAPAETEPEQQWTKENLISTFISSHHPESNQVTVYDAVVFPDRAYDRVGAVLYRINDSKAFYAAFPDENGFGQQVGFENMGYTGSPLVYDGGGTIGFRLTTAEGETLAYQVSISIEGDSTDFTVKTQPVDAAQG